MAKDPAMLFYTSDFLTGVAFLSMKERGQYITLLCLQQQLGHMSLQQMQTVVGKISPLLLDKFIQDEQGLYYNQRAEIEIRKREAHCEKQQANIRKRWAKEDTESIPDDFHGTNQGNTTVLPLENGNGNEKKKDDSSTQGKSDTTREREEQFEIFWKSYPKKVGKKDAKRAFSKVPKADWPKLVPAVERQKGSKQWQKEDGRFIPNPSTWLNQGRWDDEEPEVAQAKPFAYKRDVGHLLDAMDHM